MKFILSLFLFGCVSYSQHDKSTLEGSFGLAKALLDDGRFEEAIMEFQSIKNKYPYSKLATEAELEMANAQFEKDAFPEAQAAYELFLELHPNHPKNDYVTYQIGESLFEQLPATKDRDLTLAPQAIRTFKMVGKNYPKSEYLPKTQERLREIYDLLASKELYVADFYFRTKKFTPAIVRYEKFLKEFPLHEKVAHAMLRIGLSADESLDTEKRDRFFQELLRKFPDSEEALLVKKRI